VALLRTYLRTRGTFVENPKTLKTLAHWGVQNSAKSAALFIATQAPNSANDRHLAAVRGLGGVAFGNSGEMCGAGTYMRCYQSRVAGDIIDESRRGPRPPQLLICPRTPYLSDVNEAWCFYAGYSSGLNSPIPPMEARMQ
jgi:hypothetical protein